MTKNKALAGYAHAWLVAADGQAAAAREAAIDGEVAGMMCVIALQNAVAGATRVLGKDHPAVTKCVAEAGDLRDVRNMFTHFDNYLTGTGTLQRGSAGAQGFGWMPMWGPDETITILNRPKGEPIPTQYSVQIHHSLRSVALLVLAAVTFCGIEASPLLDKLTKDE